MKVLIAANVPKRREGGVAGVAYGVGRGLERRGHEVDFVFAGDLPASKRVPPRFQELEFAAQLAKFLLRHPRRFDVVNIHAPAGCVYGPLRMILPRGIADGPAYVMTLHGLEERRIHGLSREARKGRAPQFRLKNRLWHRVYHLPRFYFSIKTADHAICLARDTWTILQLKYNLDSSQVSYVPNGVDERFFLVRSYLQEPATRLLYAGTWLDQRGIFYIRDALRNLVQRLPGLRFTIAGCGSPAEQIKQFFEPALRQSVEVICMVPAADMPELYARHDIFVFPSVVEGTPLAMQEAMASGMAVVTTETCGMVDLVENEFNGLLVPPADAAALENAVWRLTQDSNLRVRLGRAATDTMRRFTWERTVRGVEAACVSALHRKGREPNVVSRESLPQSRSLPTDVVTKQLHQ